MPPQSGAPHTSAGEDPVARSDLLVSLVRAGAAGDRKEVATAVEAIIAEERAKQHNILADRLTRALRSHASGGRVAHPAATESTARVRDYVVEATPPQASRGPRSVGCLRTGLPGTRGGAASGGPAALAEPGAAPSGLAGRPSRQWKDLRGRSHRRSACGLVLHRPLRRDHRQLPRGDREPIATRIRLRANDPLRAVQRLGPRFDRLRTVLASDESGFRCATIRPASRPNARSSSRSRDRFQAEGQVAKQVSAGEFQAKCLRIIKEMRRSVFQDRSNGPRGRQAHSVQRSEGDLQVRGGFRRMRIGAGRPSSPLLAGCAAHMASSASSSDMRRISMSGLRSENARKPNRP